MATLKSNNFELEFLVTACKDFAPTEFYYKITLYWNGVPLLNDKAMKRHNSFWKKGSKGCLISYDLDDIHLIWLIKKAISTGKPQFLETFPDPHIYFSIYPNRRFADLNDIDSEHFTIIVSPDSYTCKKSRQVKLVWIFFI